MASTVPLTSAQRLGLRLVLGFAALLGAWFLLGLVCQLVAESLWFARIGYVEVFWLRLQVQVGLWVVATGMSLAFLVTNLRQAQTFCYRKSDPIESETPPLKRRGMYRPATPPPIDQVNRQYAPATARIRLRWLLVICLGLNALLTIVVLYYTQAAYDLWQNNSLYPGTSPLLPGRLRPLTVWSFFRHLVQVPESQGLVDWLRLGLSFGLPWLLLVYPRVLLWGGAIALSVEFGSIFSAVWGNVLQFFHAVPFQATEPVFGHDIRFYMFFLPVWQLVELWLMGLFLYGALAVLLLYLLSGNSLSQGRFPGFSPAQQRHLCQMFGWMMGAIALGYWISRYELLYSSRGVTYGASFTDVHVQLPANLMLSWVATAIALALFWKAWTYSASGHKLLHASDQRRSILRWLGSLPIPVWLGGYLALALVGTYILPLAVQTLVVQPNELDAETPYIRRSIALTRAAFDLERINVESFDPQTNLTYETLLQNELTVRNIRLWDTRPLLETNRQLQQIRPYYRFPDADVDRYTLRADQTPEKQQVLIAARELDYSGVPEEAKTWVNEHLVYTHGYGFTLSPVNQVAPGGLPYYFVKDIGTSNTDGTGDLDTSSAGIRDSIPVSHPRFYYGELTNTYVMTGTTVQELDYPSGSENVYNIYDGDGGVGLGSFWRQLVFARYFQDWRMLFTDNFTAQTKILFRRNIQQRVRAIAPFLRYDRDPYVVVAQVKQEAQRQAQTPNYLYWILDAYTVSNYYPYSEPSGLPHAAAEEPYEAINYIRNSVKVVLDAYSGSVTFYVADPLDPIIQSWMAIFPTLFRPLDTMPPELFSHIRYPVDLFTIQAERLTVYHMTDPIVFYNQEDQWQIPTEIYGTEPQPVEPYFLIMNLPQEPSEEFILLLPFKPRERTNLIAWLAARSDNENYGRSLLYQFPKQKLVYGIEQIEARINQDPAIAERIALWNRQESQVRQGNLLVIPIEQSLLYVEPLYLLAKYNSIPTLARVIAAYSNRIVMTETLEESLRALFQPRTTTVPPIIRPVEDPVTPTLDETDQ